MKEPDEKWLDRHFRQQLLEYEPVFKQKACLTDGATIQYWLQMYKAAPKQQKWARNCLMLLMYGQIKEIGRLMVPFTDMRNMGRDLNEMLDSYKGLPVISHNRSTKIILAETRERNSQSKFFNGSEETEIEINKENRENCSGTSSSTGGDSVQTLYKTFDSHACYRKWDTKTPTPKNSAYEASKPVKRTLLSSISEGQSNCEIEDRPCCSLSLQKFKCESDLAPVTLTASKACPDAPREAAQREATDADLMYLRRRNKQLRRECLIYYNRKGDLRRCPKYPKNTVKHLGFLLGAYRAHCHFTRYSWRQQSNQPMYFNQAYDRVNGWRAYRRILLISSVPRSRLRPHTRGKESARTWPLVRAVVRCVF